MTLLKAGRPSKEKALLNAVTTTEELLRVNFQVDKTLYKQIKIYATEHDLSIKELMIKAVKEFMRK